MRAAWAVVGLMILFLGCRAHPHVGRRIIVADTREGRSCFEEAQQSYQDCVLHGVRRGLCEQLRTKALLECPGARDATGEPDPTVVQLPGFRP